MKRRSKPLGFFMCLPLALVGAFCGAFLGFLALLILVGLRDPGNGQGGLFAIFVGVPIGALAGAVFGFRLARSL